MRRSFHESVEEIKGDILKMSSMVEEAVYKSIRALEERKLELAKRVIEKDDDIDDYEILLEEKCAGLIALQQPVARDLRTIMAVSRIATDLERIGDHAVNIAEMVLEIGDAPLIKPLIDIPRMTGIVTKRLRECLEAFINHDIELAERTAREDEELDILERQIFRELITFMLED